MAGTAIGLLISALALSEEAATALVPIAVIPQIILAGVVAPLEGPARLLAQGLITVYRGQQALESLLPETDWRILGRQAEGFADPCAIVLAQAAAAAIVVLWQTRARANSR